MKVERLDSKNYKNLSNPDGIELEHLNVLIGPNGSGKSNLISLLRFLQNCLTDSAGEDRPRANELRGCSFWSGQFTNSGSDHESTRSRHYRL